MFYSFRKFYFSLLLVSFICFITSCSLKEEAKYFLVDNPTKEAITVIFDGTPHQIPASSSIYVQLAQGQHTMEYKDSKVKFLIVPCDQDMVINPTLSNYVLSYQVYFDIDKGFNEDEVKNIKSAYLFPFITDSNDTIQVPFEVLNPLFIERYKYYWNFGLKDANKEVQTLEVGKEYNINSTILANLYRESDFKRKNELPDDFQLPKTYASYSDLPVTSADVLFGGLKADDKEFQDIIELRKAKFDSLLVASPADMKWFLSGLEGTLHSGTDITTEMQKKYSPRYDNSRKTNFDSIYLLLPKRYQEFIGARNAIVIQ